MPALPFVPSVLKARLHWGESGDPDVYNTLYFAYSGSEPDGDACSNFATVICNAFGAMIAQWNELVVLAGCEVTDLTSDTAGQGSATSDFPGSGSGELLGGSTCVLVNYEIARRYRGGKPRNYFPWGTSATLETRQSWTADFVAGVASDLATCFSTIIGTTEGGATITNHVNVSYYNGFTVVNPGGGKRARNVPTLRETPLVDDIVSRSVSGQPASQRRRNKV